MNEHKETSNFLNINRMAAMTDPQNADFERFPSLRDTTRVWLRIGVLSFGGPAAQIALMHKEVVDDRGWLSEENFLSALSFCMLLPGPEAMQLATYTGWRLHGTLGGLLAGLLFVMPGAAVILALALIYGSFGDLQLIVAAFYGIKAAVLVVVIEALVKVTKRALVGRVHRWIAGFAFAGIFFLAIPFPIIVLFSAIMGFIFSPPSIEYKPIGMKGIIHIQSLRVVAFWLGVWILPFLALHTFGAPDILIEIAGFFSRLAIVTFGGAYAVLAYMAQDIVGQFGWLSAGEMIDALGLAETTPGPLILVTEFVSFLAAFKEGGLWLGVLAALVALWVTFTPCFLWIFAGAPYLEWISSQPKLKNALSFVSASVVGVILNLSVWFGLHVLFSKVEQSAFGMFSIWIPDPRSVEWLAVCLFFFSCIMVFKWQWSILNVLILISILGSVISLLL